MATERNTSTVLAKLMGIDRLLLVPSQTRPRRRLLSHNYLHYQNAVLLDGNTNVSNMDADDIDNAACDETLEFHFSEKPSEHGHQSIVRLNADSSLIPYSHDSRMKTNSHTTPSFRRCQGFDQGGVTGSHSLQGHLAAHNPFSVSQVQKYKSVKTQLGQRRSFYNIDTAISSACINKKKKAAASGVNSKGLAPQERRMNRLRHNVVEYSHRENVSLKDIAKQITHQVNHSVWHNCVKYSRYEASFDKRETQNKSEMSASGTSKTSSRNTQNTISESCSSKKYEKVTACHTRTTEHQMHLDGIPRKYDTPSCSDTLPNANAYRFRVATARFLSKPTLFPSAWVPRSKERCFSLDQNWCLRPENKNSNLCNESSEDNINRLDDSFSACREPEEVTLADKMHMSNNLQGGKLPVRLNKSIIFDDAASSRKDFVLEHELKSKTSPPGSPVSSLEGPEACKRHLNFIVSSKDDVLGLPTKLHLIEAMSTESGSEGAGMVISSDASDGGGSTICYREDTQIEEPTSEGFHFCYLVDVLAESGMLMGDLEMESFVLEASVFELLENKYGKSDLMKRSERRLLFDRIKSGVVDIVRPCVGVDSWRKPVVKRLRGLSGSWEFVEEEVWGMLVKEEEEVKRNMLDRVFDSGLKWLDLEEDVVLMVEDIQRLLIDELVEELSLEMLCACSITNM